MKLFKSWKIETVLPWLLIICGTIGLICAFIISFDEFRLSGNASYVPSCNLNPIISCGSVMKSAQSHIFGFPNPFIGLMAFPVVITTGVVMLMGVKPKRWYMLGLEAGTIFGIGFIHWLFFQSVYRIHALCPWCMGVWLVTIVSFWYVTQYNLTLKYIVLPGKLAAVTKFVREHHLDLVILWILIIAGFILKHFWYYYGPKIFGS